MVSLAAHPWSTTRSTTSLDASRRTGLDATMERRGKATDRYGARLGSPDRLLGEAEEEDFRFWYEELTPEERVRAVEECALSTLKARSGGRRLACPSVS